MKTIQKIINDLKKTKIRQDYEIYYYLKNNGIDVKDINIVNHIERIERELRK